MICKKCGTDNKESANFCRMCSTKLQTICECWVKKEPYNCGQGECPGYRLFAMEAKASQVVASEGDNQIQ